MQSLEFPAGERERVMASLLDEGLRHHERGELRAAASVYGVILKMDPRHADAMHLLGMTASSAGMIPMALDLIARAIKLNPRVAAYHSNLGSILQAQGLFAEAVAEHEQAILLDDKIAEVHLNLGLAEQSMGNLEAAIKCYERAAVLKPRMPEVWSNLGNALEEKGGHEEAIRHYRRALELRPEFPEAWYNLGNALQACEQWEESRTAYLQAIALRENFAEAHSNLANVLAALAESGEAERHFRRAIELRPNYADAHFNLGNLFAGKDRLLEAAAHFELALRTQPGMLRAHNNLAHVYRTLEHYEEAEAHYRIIPRGDAGYIDAYNNYGLTLLALGRHDEAEEITRHAADLLPGFGQTHCNLGAIYHSQNRIEEARACYQRALDLNPKLSKAQLNRGMIELVSGDFERGWRDYELRWEDAPLHRRDFTQPQWQGEEITGKRLLVHAEQGLGDTLQFMRYLPMVRERGSQLLFEVKPRLASLMREFADVTVCIEGEKLPDFDVHIPLLSLPLIFGHTSEEKLPRTVPYIRVPEAARAKCAARLQPRDGALHVGLLWAGNPSFLHDRFRFRSLPLEQMKPLLDVPGVRYFSLQIGEQLEELRRDEELCKQIVDLSPYVDEMADTAAQIEALDLVISADSAVAHLAAGLGKPTWLLLPFAPDWRWMQKRRDTPWYPTMELFRQPTPGNWSPLIAEMRARLMAGF